MAFSEHCWKSHIMDYGLLIIHMSFCASYANARARERLLCPTCALFYASTNACNSKYTVRLKFKFNVSKSAHLRPHFRSSQEFDLTQRWFFKNTLSNSASSLGRRRYRNLCSRRSEEEGTSSCWCWTKYCLSKRNWWWCYLSRTQPHTENLKRIPTVLVDLDPEKQSADRFKIMTLFFCGFILTACSHEEGFLGSKSRWTYIARKAIVIVFALGNQLEA